MKEKIEDDILEDADKADLDIKSDGNITAEVEKEPSLAPSDAEEIVNEGK